MQVFKLFNRIILRNKSSFLMYFAVVLGITLLFVSGGGAGVTDGFQGNSVRLAADNRDNGPLSNALVDYLAAKTTLVPLPGDEEALRESLFFEDIQYVLVIPEGFSQRFLAGDGDAALERMVGSDRMSPVLAELLINRFLNLAGLYRASLPDLSAEDLAGKVSQGLTLEADADLLSTLGSASPSLQFYFRFYSYGCVAALLLCVSSVMMAVNKPTIRRRHAASPLAPMRLSIQLALGGVLLALLVWAVMSGVGIGMFGQGADRGTLVMLAANALCYALVCLSLAFMFSYLIKSHNVQSAVANLVTISLSFLSGVFVPVELLGEGIRRLSIFLPTYWYVRTVDLLDPGMSPSPAASAAFAQGLLIQAGFAAAFLALSLLLARRKSQSIA